MNGLSLKVKDWIENITPWIISGGLRILFTIIVSVIVFFILKKIIKRIVVIAVTPGERENAAGEAQRENTLMQIFTVTLKVLIIIVTGLMIASELGIKIGPLLASAGVVGLALGFGGQYLIKDLISGLFIIIENQYRINDVIEIAGLSGKVERISLRMTQLRDMDGNTHFIPHGEVTTVTNSSKIFARINLDMGVGYGSDIEQVKKIVNEVGQQMLIDTEWKEKLITPPAFLRVQELADSAVIVKVTGDTMPGEQWGVSGELLKRIYEAFNNAGIEIPFPQQTVHFANAPVKA